MLTVEDGVLLTGSRICIPPELHDRTLYDLHHCHQGIEKMTHIARSSVYCPSIDADIADYIRCCTIWAKHKVFQSVQPMLPCNVPDGPWQEIAADYLPTVAKNTYLLQTHLVNTHSYHEFIPRPQTVLPTTYKTFFSQYGNPKCFYSNNAPPFSSEPFSNFLPSLGIDHIKILTPLSKV